MRLGRHRDWKVLVAVRDGDRRAGFRWATFQAVHATEEEAREWVKTHWYSIRHKYELYQFEKDDEV
jgi:hypothetical protein